MTEERQQNVRVKLLVLDTWHVSVSESMVAVWRSRTVLVFINEVNLRRARLVLGWVTVSTFDSRRRHFITFHVSHKQREMYCGHVRLSVWGRMPTLLHGHGSNQGEC